MSRYFTEIQTPFTMEQAGDIASKFLISEGFKLVDYNNEKVWQKGDGWMTGPSFIKLNYADNKIKIEAWIKFAVLPFVFVGEMGLDGFFAAIPKSTLSGRVTTLIRLLSPPQQIPAVN